MAKQLYEFTGYRTYGIVIAADTEEAAKKELKKLGNDWSNYAEDIGFNSVDSLELVDVRDPTSDDLEDEAHIVVEDE